MDKIKITVEIIHHENGLLSFYNPLSWREILKVYPNQLEEGKRNVIKELGSNYDVSFADHGHGVFYAINCRNTMRSRGGKPTW